MSSISGIDVSNSQGTIDWEQVKKSGIKFAIIRLGWGGDAPHQDDPKFKENVAACEKLGIRWGAYIYSYALNLDAVTGEVKHALRMLDGKKPPLGVWFDMEDMDGYKAKHGLDVRSNRRLITDMCIQFCEMMKRTGYEAGIYANQDFFEHVMYKNELTKYPFWLAYWASAPYMNCKVWQYSSKGKVPGINGNVDMDILYADGVVPKPVEPTCKVTVEKIICKSGSQNDDVKLLQWLLNNLGFKCGAVDGIFGAQTKGAVTDYQKTHSACGTPDGVCGPKTWTSLLS